MLKKHQIRMGGGSTVEFKSHRWMRLPYITKYLYLSIYLSIFLSTDRPTRIRHLFIQFTHDNSHRQSSHAVWITNSHLLNATKENSHCYFLFVNSRCIFNISVIYFTF